MVPYFQRIAVFAVLCLLPSIRMAESVGAWEKIDELLAWNRLQGQAQTSHWNRSLENMVLTNGRNCGLKETTSYQSARYFQLDCKSQSLNAFINFQDKSLDASKPWKLKKTHTFGNKKYIEIQFIENTSLASKQKNPENRFEKNETLKSKEDQSLQDNPNLKYFVETALFRKKYIQASPNLAIFFDHSCPLEYLGENHDFYWDDKIYHDFYITCVQDSLVSLIRLEGTKLGEIQIGNLLRKDIKKGEKFLASIVLKDWQDDRILWGEFKIYPYEN